MKKFITLFLTLVILAAASSSVVAAPAKVDGEPGVGNLSWLAEYVPQGYGGAPCEQNPFSLFAIDGFDDLLQTKLEHGKGDGSVISQACRHCEDRCRIGYVQYTCPPVWKRVCSLTTVVVGYILGKACKGHPVVQAACYIIPVYATVERCDNIKEPERTCTRYDECAYKERVCFNVMCGD